MKLGYITNGFAHHTLESAIEVLAELGYGAVGITLDHNHLDPFDPDGDQARESIRGMLDQHGMTSAIETGARFLLDPRLKHEPTLITPDAVGRVRRLAFYEQAIETAAVLGSRVVSIWSGRLHPGVNPGLAEEWLVAGCRTVCDLAGPREIDVCFEPEPGMLIETIDGYLRVAHQIARDNFKLTVDVGHLACVEDGPPADHIIRARDHLAHVHIDDIAGGVHEHRPFGEGEIEFAPVIEALKSIDYAGLLLVELSRDSHRAPQVARAAIDFLRGQGA